MINPLLIMTVLISLVIHTFPVSPLPSLLVPLIYVFKPLPIVILLAQTSVDRTLFVGVLFSLCGDLLLMPSLSRVSESFSFIGGLACFAVSHCFYIALMLRAGSINTAINKGAHIFIALYAYAAALVYYLSSYLPSDLLFPVCVYGGLLGSMSSLALSAHLNASATQRNNTKYTAIGAILFLISDSLLAINQFAHPFPYARVAVMSTYYAAQYGIVRGMLLANQQHAKKI